MNQLIEYLKDTFGVEITILKNNLKLLDNLPFHLMKGYKIIFVRLGETELVFAKPTTSEYPSPDQLKKQMEQIEKIIQLPGVFVFERINTYARKRMIQNRTAFIIENRQVYIPFMFLDLEESKSEKQERSFLSPSSQCILIYHLMVGSLEGTNLKSIAKLLGYSSMTATRSVKELEGFELCRLTRAKDKRIHFDLGKEKLWPKARGFMKSPIKKKIWISDMPENVQLLLSGISALAGNSNISEDREISYAASTKNSKQLDQELRKYGNNLGYGNYCIEFWRYDPQILGHSGKVDSLSLYLSLLDNEDERVQQALEQMIDELW